MGTTPFSKHQCCVSSDTKKAIPENTKGQIALGSAAGHMGNTWEVEASMRIRVIHGFRYLLRVLEHTLCR
jgi:hypothetical protein